MNTKHLKAYAPKARLQFMEAVTQRAAHYGLYADRIAEVQFDGGAAVIEGRAFSRAEGERRNKLVRQVEAEGFEAFVQRVAYTWFNRLAAIRFMELQDYLEHGFRVLSHPEQSTGFEILDHAAEVCDLLALDKDRIVDLTLAGNQDEQLYRTLLLGQCHYLHQVMPFLFEALDDATELLLPDNLTKTDSLLHDLVTEVPESDWDQIEVIGWLYQFYISDHKDAVIGKVVKSADIPAATQLFTPNWIVKYLVENSVGRQWLATYPDSTLKGKMEYYIEPAEQSEEVLAQLKAITPESLDPEAIKVLDPACGSGHILIEVYVLLREIYLERGYRLRDIPALILTKNIYGLDIDDRAAQLSGFALLMKAREDDRRIFSRVQDDGLRLNVLAMQSSEGMDLAALWRGLNLDGAWQHGTGADLFDNQQVQLGDASADSRYQLLLELVGLFREAKTFGSLIDVPAEWLDGLLALRDTLLGLVETGDGMQRAAAGVLLPLVEQAGVLARRYDAVVANPPYMGSAAMDTTIKKFVNNNYPGAKNDLFACFIDRSYQLATNGGDIAMVTMQSWMFLSSFEALRERMLRERTISTMAQIGFNSFPSLNSKIALATVFSLVNHRVSDYEGTYIDLNNAPQSSDKEEVFLSQKKTDYFRVSSDKFKNIPGSPIAYWVNDKFRQAFINGTSLKEMSEVKHGLSTGKNAEVVRSWAETNIQDIGFNFKSRDAALSSHHKWFPYNKGGGFRKWYGNCEFILRYDNYGNELMNSFSGHRHDGKDYYFKEGVTWTFIAICFSARYTPPGFVFDVAGSSLFCEKPVNVVGFLCSNLCFEFLKTLNPTLNFQVGNLKSLPLISEIYEAQNHQLSTISKDACSIAQTDWDSFERSWEFKKNPLLLETRNSHKTQTAYTEWQTQNHHAITEIKHLEEENNRLFINAYDLQDELTPEVPLQQITLTVNPRYRYGGKATDEELNNRFQSDTSAELISYSIGCMMGRYSLDKAGLIYAHANNEGFTDLQTQGAYNTYPADDDGIIPLTDQEWFSDDATTRFRDFIKTAWDETHLNENLDFVAESLTLHALKPKTGEASIDTIRRYLSTQFYKDHLKTYKKRPIYWLFSSGKNKAFECLVYLHRYNEGTLARMRTEYVTPLMGKFDAYHTQLGTQMEGATTTQQRQLEKERKLLEKKQAELSAFDENLNHFANRRISINLDDGVKENYGKFGTLLADVKAIHGKLPAKTQD